MAQEKVKITFDDGTSSIHPADNVDRIRNIVAKMSDKKIESIVTYTKTVAVKKTTVTPVKTPQTQSLSQKNEQKHEEIEEFTKNKGKLIDAGFIYNAGLDLYERGEQSITSEALAKIKPMQLGKLIKKTN